MKRFILCAILVLAMATQAYGFGWFDHDNATNNPPAGGVAIQSTPVQGSNSETAGNPVSVPEPATLLLLAAGLVGLYGLRRKFRKN